MAHLHEIPGMIHRALRTGTNLHIVGEPGMGKTSIIEQTVEKIRGDNPDFWFDVIYTPSLSPVDFVAMMPDPATQMLKPYRHSKLPNAFDKPDLKGLLFLGERDNADPATNKALQKYINNEDMGGLRKPEGVIVVSDSNDISHRSGAVQQSLALLSRSRFIKVDNDPEITLKHFGEIGIYPYVQAFLSLRKDLVSTFGEVTKHREYRVWANPRSWERISKAHQDAETFKEVLTDEEIIGDVGEAVGREYIAFLHAARELVSYDEIIAKPNKAVKSDKMSDMYAIIAMLAHTVKAEDMPAVKTYVCRYGHEIQVLFLRMLVSAPTAHKNGCIRSQSIVEWFSDPEMSKLVTGSGS